MRHKFLLGMLLVAISLATGSIALAQTETSTNSILLAPVAPTTQVTNATLQVSQPTTWEFFKRRFWHLFTLDRYQRLNQETDLASMTLLAARQAQLAGNADRAQALLGNFDTSMTQSSTRIAELIGQSKDASDVDQIEQLLTNSLRARVFEAGLAEQMSLGDDANTAKRALEVRLVTLSQLTRFLAFSKTADTAYVSRVQAVVDILAKNEPDQTKLAASLMKISLLEEITGRLLETNPRLALVQQIEVGELDSIAKLGSDQVQLAVTEFNQSFLNHESLVASLLSRVPVIEQPVVTETTEAEEAPAPEPRVVKVVPTAPVITPQIEQQVEQLKEEQVELEKEDEHEIDD